MMAMIASHFAKFVEGQSGPDFNPQDIGSGMIGWDSQDEDEYEIWIYNKY